jgi:hypothetical protein
MFTHPIEFFAYFVKKFIAAIISDDPYDPKDYEEEEIKLKLKK